MCKTSLSVIHRQLNRKTQLKIILKLKEYSYEDPKCIIELTEGLWFFLLETCKKKIKKEVNAKLYVNAWEHIQVNLLVVILLEMKSKANS